MPKEVQQYVMFVIFDLGKIGYKIGVGDWSNYLQKSTFIESFKSFYIQTTHLAIVLSISFKLT